MLQPTTLILTQQTTQVKTKKVRPQYLKSPTPAPASRSILGGERNRPPRPGTVYWMHADFHGNVPSPTVSLYPKTKTVWIFQLKCASTSSALAFVSSSSRPSPVLPVSVFSLKAPPRFDEKKVPRAGSFAFVVNVLPRPPPNGKDPFHKIGTWFVSRITLHHARCTDQKYK